MDRRRALSLFGSGVTVALTGCLSEDSESGSGVTITDSDGDGVIDSEDYAPNDPEVQRKAQLTKTQARSTKGATTTSTEATTTVTLSSTPETTTAASDGGQSVDGGPPTTTTDSSDEHNSGEVDIETTTTTTTTTTETATETTETTGTATTIDADYEDVSNLLVAYFRSYSTQSAEFSLYRSEFENIEDTMSAVVFAQEYPDGEVLASDTIETVSIGDGYTTETISYDLSAVRDADADHFLFAVALYPEDNELEDTEESEFIAIGETDRLTFDNDTLTKDEHPDAKDDLDQDAYERVVGEGRYAITVEADFENDASTSVDDASTFNITVSKSAYIKSSEKKFQTTTEVIRDAKESGIASSLASLLNSAAEENGYSTARKKVNYTVEIIQALPYVADSVDDGYDDYNKYPIETLVEAGGDCEDTVIFGGAALYAEPFSYGIAAIFIPYDEPTHVALGVKGEEDVVGTYYEIDDTRYYYVETTGEGWDIGEVPDEYDGEDADVQVI